MAQKILVVDDDADFRKEFTAIFSEYEVIGVPDGEQALEILKKPNEIDLVVLDVKMPRCSGTEILHRLKAISPGLPIIILTGYSSEDVAIEALKGHADDYIEKPFDIDKTREIIEKLLASRSSASASSDKIESVKCYIERNCFRKVSLQDAAKIVGLSYKYLSRILKKTTGKSFNEYRLETQINKSRELLTKSNLNINEISDKLGYQNPESFIRAFKKLEGCTPSAYRKQKRGK
ncbi:MAG: response regulator [Candidatus Omnitrophica bacterium]|nr:response regulator [Candidatus Omnitrophota bacterium]